MRLAIERQEAVTASGNRVVDSRVRLRRLVIVFAAVLLVTIVRLAWLEQNEGRQFRELAARPLERFHWLPGMRGRVLSRDGIVLAEDRPLLSVAVDYRWLAERPDPKWLRRTARQRLALRGMSPRARRDPVHIAAEVEAIHQERLALHQRLAVVCGLDHHEWNARTATIQTKVASLAGQVNARRLERYRQQVRQLDTGLPTSPDLWLRLRGAVMNILFPADIPAPPARITISEEVDDHILVEDVSLDVVAEIEAHPQRYPGTRIVQQSRRAYPAGSRAAHIVGHLGAAAPGELVAAGDAVGPRPVARQMERIGRLGVERQYEAILRGDPGVELETTDRAGRVLARRMTRAPGCGRDVVLTLDSAVQATAEALLDAVLARRRRVPSREEDPHLGGGAVVVLDVNSGAILAAASAPRFDPAAFLDRDLEPSIYLSDRNSPLVDRVTKMALPPGSVFKVVTAIALLEQGIVRPDEEFECQGYLRDPASERCAMFARHGQGHGSVALETALARSCNVYFFHHGGRLKAPALLDWAGRCGFGKCTGVDLSDEAPGNLPAVSQPTADTSDFDAARDLRATAIGQGKVTATPLQVARLMAAVANGGRLVTPYVVAGCGLPTNLPAGGQSDAQPVATGAGGVPQTIPGLHTSTLDNIRRALVRVVADPDGSAHASVYLDGLSIAGKTGTAEAGGDRADHAWFAGYAPAESPRVAFAVALEHGGGGAEAAGPVARRLVQRLAQLGYLGRGGAQRVSHQVPIR